MCGFRALPAWKEVRLLTTAAYQFLGAPKKRKRAATAVKIQNACIELMLAIQLLGEQSGNDATAITAARHATRRIADLLDEAHREGLLGTLELVLMMRGTATIRQTLTKETFLTVGHCS